LIANAADQQNVALYIVGGFVRDLLLDLPSLDFDLVVEGDAIELAKSISSQFGGRVTSHTRFGTAKWHLPEAISDGELFISTDNQFVDLVTARREFYQHPTALPTVERGSIKLDLHRRDFTINTLALRLDGPHYGELHDNWGGLQDIKQGLVRVLHSLSFVDDPTRMLRAARFEQRFDFVIGERTLELLSEARNLLDRISSDRIRHELDSILIENRSANILARLSELHLLSTIHVDLKWDDWLCDRISSIQSDLPAPDWELTNYDSGLTLKRDLSYVIWLIRLSSIKAQGVISRLKLPVNLAGAILSACELWRNLPNLVESSPSDTVDQLEDLPPLSRYAVYLATSDEQLRLILIKYAKKWRKIHTNITGHDLKERGLPPSSAYRYIIKALRDAWLDERISKKEQELDLLAKLIETHPYDVNF
jgi:tRNA nucleotidyltransferase (CCA-adding enzyme)